MRPVTEYTIEVDGQTIPVLKAPLVDPARLSRDAGDPTLCEYLVRVQWIATRPTSDAIWRTGLFTNQMPACKLRDPDTIGYLEDAFEVLKFGGAGFTLNPISVTGAAQGDVQPCRALLHLACGTGRLLLAFAVAGPRRAVVPRRDESRAGSGPRPRRAAERGCLSADDASGHSLPSS